MIENRLRAVNLNTITSFDNLLSSSNPCTVLFINGATSAPKKQRPLSSPKSVKVAKLLTLIWAATSPNHQGKVAALSVLRLRGGNMELSGLVWRSF